MTDVFLDEGSDHYLTVLLNNGKLDFDFKCVNHEGCELQQKIVERVKQSLYCSVPSIVEWFIGKETLLRDGFVNLWEYEGFVEWCYVNEGEDLGSLLEDLNSPHHSYALVGVLHEHEGLSLKTVPVNVEQKKLESNGGNTPLAVTLGRLGEGELLQGFAGEAGTSFRNDYVRVWVDEHDYDSPLLWDYEVD